MEKAIPTVCQLLGSKTISDVNESIEFFVVATEFGLQSAIIGVRRMLVLIWSRDIAVRDAVVEAYKGLYLDPVAPNVRYAPCLSCIKDRDQAKPLNHKVICFSQSYWFLACYVLHRAPSL